MNHLNRNWTVYVIHHSHTDIGYTDRQEKIEKYHVEFIKQAVEISEKGRSGERKEWQGFHWTCETFWAVELFLKKTSSEWHERFKRALQLGDIDLSCNYLNMTELINYDILHDMTLRCVDFAKSIGVSSASAMTADINGYGWGYAKCLAEAGVQNLLSCTHTTFGFYPLGRKQTPFWWETAEGNRLLVWNGDHYNLGNELGIAPGAIFSHIIRDEFEFDKPISVNKHWEMAETRLSRYLAQLEQEEFPYSFVPVTISGLITDNAPPNRDVMTFIHHWNKKHADRIRIETIDLDGFFNILRKQPQEIPVHRGDWPDWWSDGVASAAMHTQMFRQAQRKLTTVKRLDPDNKIVKEETFSDAQYQLMLYAEHTFGYAASVLEPWNPLVQELNIRKDAYAANAQRLVSEMLDEVLHELGEAPLAADRPLRFKVINPMSYRMEDYAHLRLEFWEIPLLSSGFEVIREMDGQVVEHQMNAESRGSIITIPVSLEADESQIFSLRPLEKIVSKTTSSFLNHGVDGVCDFEVHLANASLKSNKVLIDETSIESNTVRISWRSVEGIVSWMDKKTGQDLISANRKHPAFSPIYEVTRLGRNEKINGRIAMGRNRKGRNVERSVGKLIQVKAITEGNLFGTVELTYEMEGTDYFSLLLTVYNHSTRVDVKVRMDKNSNWDPENMYISLPFRTVAMEQEDEIWLEKTGAVLRPRKDQLPGTLTDYYSIQEGYALCNNSTGIAIATPDTPLLQLGPLEYGQRLLNGNEKLNSQNEQPYSWVLNNFWCTNFKASVGGFYEFRYFLQWGQKAADPEEAMQLCRAMNQGIISVRTV